MELIQQGAEAKLYRDKNKLLKKRIKKEYRIPEIDEKIRKQNTKREFKLIKRASEIIPVPKLIKQSDYEIDMEFIEGERLRDVLETKKNKYALARQIGKQVGLLHSKNIIHGDLTTSNMIIRVAPLSTCKEIVFIDFGLGFISEKIEDKAVDLHLIKQAFESTHYKIHEKLFKAFLKGYSSCGDSRKVLERLEIVEKRGRYKKKGEI